MMGRTILFTTTFIVVVYAVMNTSGNDGFESFDYYPDYSDDYGMLDIAHSIIKDIVTSWWIGSQLNTDDDLLSLMAWETSVLGSKTIMREDEYSEFKVPDIDQYGHRKKLNDMRNGLRDSFYHEFSVVDRKYTCSLCIKDPGNQTLCAEVSTVPTNNTLTVTTKMDNIVQTSENIDVFDPLAFCLTVPNLTLNRYCLMTYDMHYDNSDFGGCFRVDYHVWFERYDFPAVCVVRDSTGQYSAVKRNQSEQSSKWKLFHEHPLPKVNWSKI